ncbi:MAG: APC family permease [Ilumatobacteraceae bacterium]
MSDTTTSTGLAKGQLSTIDCITQSLAVGPVFSGALLGAILAGWSAGAGSFVVVLTAICILALGRIVSEFAKRYSGSGTVYEFIARSLGKRAAVFAAGSYHAAVIALGGGGIAVIGGLLLRDFLNVHAGTSLNWWVCSIIVLVFLFIINSVGVKMSMKAQLGLIVASIVPFLILFVRVVFGSKLDGAAGNGFDSFNPSNVGEGGSLFKGILFAILMFVGFELSAALGEETKDPKKSIPRAVVSTIVIIAVFYVITQYTLAAGGTADVFDFAPMAEEYLNHFFAIWIELAILLDVLAVGIGFQLAAARGVYSLARDSVLPKALAATNKRQQPIGGVITVTAIAALLMIVTLAKHGTGLDVDDGSLPDLFFNQKAFYGFLAFSTIGGMLICMVYLLVCLGALKLFALKNPIDVVAAVIAIGVCALGVAAQFISGLEPAPPAQWSRIAAIVIAVVVAIYAATAKKDVIESVAQHAMEHD